MTKDLGSQSPVESPSDEQYKSKRGRKPSQAKLAMLESKKLFAEKRKIMDSDNGDGSGRKHAKKKKLIEYGKTKKNAEGGTKLKKKRNKVKTGVDLDNQLHTKAIKRNFKKEDVKGEDAEDETRKGRHKVHSRFPSELSDYDSSEEELWEETKATLHPNGVHYDERDDLFFDSDDDNDLDNELLQNSDEDTEDASETDMATLEEEISEMKEQMYQEKIKELKGKLEELRNKTLPQYVQHVEELKRHKEEWIRMAYAFKEYEIHEIEKEYEREKRQAKEDFEEKKSELKEIIISELSEKKKTIENEKSTLELTSGVASILPMEVKPVVTRKLRRRPNEPPPVTEKKRKTTTAQLNFLLSDEAIAMDLKKISKHFKPAGEEKVAVKTIKPEKCDPSEFPDGSDAKIKDDKLYFNEEWYESGDPIYLDSKDGERFNAQIHSISSTREIWIKKLTEGTRLKIYVGHLQRGKYSFERREVPAKKL